MIFLYNIFKISSKYFILILFSITVEITYANEFPTQEALPNPLTLEKALLMASRSHPDLSLANAKIEQTKSKLLEVQSRQGLNAFIELSPETIAPSTGGSRINDSHARLFIGKTLYDFGRTQTLEKSAKASIESKKYDAINIKINHEIKILQLYFAVMLADLRFKVDNENLAYLFVRYDQLNERYKLGMISETDILRAENIYREMQIKKTKSEKQQRATRQQLALSLNRPTDLPTELVEPNIQNKLKKPPDLKTLFDLAIISNPYILSLKNKINTAKADLDAEYARRRPILQGELVLNEYTRDLPGRSNVRLGLKLKIPLYQGGKINASIKNASSKLSIYKSYLLQAQYTLRQKCLDLIQQLETLHINRVTAQQRLTYRDLHLDKQRALYEMEIQSNLGNAMTKMTEAQWQATKVDFDIALTWARINALLGKSPVTRKGEI